MRYDAIGLICQGAVALKRRDPGTAYALYELANNLRLLMRGEADLAEWLTAYSGHEGDPLDIEKLLPARRRC